MTDTESTNPRVMIIGGGSAGLLVAQGLKKLGINYTVFEQDRALDARVRDWNFGIYWAQSRLAECLPPDMGEKFIRENAQVDKILPTAEDTMPIWNGATGEIVRVIPLPFSFRLQRRKFLRVLSKDVDIEYGRRLVKIETEGASVTATFADGSREKGNLLIGAEGAHSKTREFLLGPEKAALKKSPVVSSVSMTKMPAEAALKIRKLHKRQVCIFHPSGIFGWFGVHDCPDPCDPSSWTFMVMQTWIPNASSDSEAKTTIPDLSTKVGIIQDMKQRGQLFGEPFKSLWDAIPDDAPAWHNRLSYWPTQEWDNRNGTVTLIGDAAHPMTFHRGQGLNNAIHDAASLLQALRQDYLPKESGSSPVSPFIEALKTYEAEVWPRGREAVLSNNENSESVHDWNRLQQSALFTLGARRKEEALNG